MALGVRLLALFAGVALIAVPQASAAPGGDSWVSLRVPHLTVPAVTSQGYHYPTSVRFGRNRMQFPRWGVTSMAATTDAAIVVSQTSQVEFGPLLELPAQGRPGRVLERRPLGIPLADPAGHVVFWSRETGRASRLVAYDTASRVRQVGPKVDAFARVFAVDGATAYVVGYSGDVSSWRSGDPSLTPLPALGAQRLLTDVHGDRALFTDFDHHATVVTDLAGTPIGSVPRAFYATFSPDGTSFVAYHRQSRRLYDAATLQEVRLTGLHGRVAYQSRWSPDGVLVLSLAPKGSHPFDDDVRLSFVSCSLPEGACRRLPGRSNSAFEPFYESSALGQLIPLIGD